MIARERGHTLLEVLVSVLLLGLALAPLLQLYPSLVAANESHRDRAQLAAAASSKREELGQGLRRGTASPGAGSAACPGLPNCLVTWEVQTELSSATPRVGSLWTVRVTACADANSSGACEAQEPQVRYDTKVTSRP